MVSNSFLSISRSLTMHKIIIGVIISLYKLQYDGIVSFYSDFWPFSLHTDLFCDFKLHKTQGYCWSSNHILKYLTIIWKLWPYDLCHDYLLIGSVYKNILFNLLINLTLILVNWWFSADWSIFPIYWSIFPIIKVII